MEGTLAFALGKQAAAGLLHSVLRAEDNWQK
jgi:hypothetical protein